MAAKAKPVDWKQMAKAWEDTDALLSKHQAQPATERQAVRYWSEVIKEEFKSEDQFVFEMAFKYGRADVVIFHIDGTASVVEAKDGTNGYRHVVAGIGQAALYAAQLGLSTGAPRKIRRCLLWTSTGDALKDEAIKEACRAADTTPICIGDSKQLMALCLAQAEWRICANDFLAEIQDGDPEEK